MTPLLPPQTTDRTWIVKPEKRSVFELGNRWREFNLRYFFPSKTNSSQGMGHMFFLLLLQAHLFACLYWNENRSKPPTSSRHFYSFPQIGKNGDLHPHILACIPTYLPNYYSAYIVQHIPIPYHTALHITYTTLYINYTIHYDEYIDIILHITFFFISYITLYHIYIKLYMISHITLYVTLNYITLHFTDTLRTSKINQQNDTLI